MDLSIVEKAGIGASHFARLCGVSRVSAYMWLTGRYGPRGLYRKQVEEMVRRIQSAVDDHRLPLPPSLPRAQVFKATQDALEL
jgi:hypothetical protein